MTEEQADYKTEVDDAKHSPGPWSTCNDGECKCKQVWSVPADHPVAVIESGEWGDSAPEIRHKENGEAYIDNGFMAYGSIKEETAVANARLIAAAPELLEALKGIAEEGCCQSPGCSTDDPMCTSMIARTAVEKVAP